VSRTRDLRDRARALIPGGTQLLSKQPERFHPAEWPAYYARARGVEIEDLDGRRWIDVSIHGIGACPLGYADPDVDAAVVAAVRAGSMSILSCPEEVALAERLCELHPWAEQVRYARCGGEAMAVAVRIARASTGRDRVAFSGYHGWHDWYVAANLADRHALDAHLMSDLDPIGVPAALAGSALPFDATDVTSLERLLDAYGPEIAAVVLEPARYDEPSFDQLARLRDVAHDAGCVLVFDEITSGFRSCVGGIHLRIGVHPDLAVFAKGMSNGHPMAAVVGRRDVMEAASRSFVSSTYWTDRVGPAAALATIDKLQRTKAPDHLAETGSRMRAGWEAAARRQGLKIATRGLAPMPTLQIEDGDDPKALATLYTQSMLEHGFLASSAFYATLAHETHHLDAALDATEQAFAALRSAIDADAVHTRLRGPVAIAGPRRREAAR